MEESTTYQELIEKGKKTGLERGRLAEALGLVLRQGTKRFGAPSPQTQAAVNAMTDVKHLEDLADRLFDGTACAWTDLLM